MVVLVIGVVLVVVLGVDVSRPRCRLAGAVGSGVSSSNRLLVGGIANVDAQPASADVSACWDAVEQVVKSILG